jgi:hypothetical protein
LRRCSFLARVRSSPVLSLRAVFALAFLTLQWVVPTVLLFGARPARFGWQMFAAHTRAPAFAVEHRDGTRAVIAIDDYFAFRRGDLDPAAFERVPAHLCALDSSIATVYEQRVAQGPIDAHPCR